MVRVLHLLKGDPGLAVAVIERQAAAGDAVTVALLHGGTAAPALPPGVRVIRVPDDGAWEDLLDEIFAADHVLTW